MLMAIGGWNNGLSRCQEIGFVDHSNGSCSSSVLPQSDEMSTWNRASLATKVRRIRRFFRRLIKLSFTLAPVVVFYPFLLLLHKRDPDEDAQAIVLRQNTDKNNETKIWADLVLNSYLRLCLRCVENSGAAVIKLMQWAGSRPDLFGSSFCAVFSKLQDNTTPHAWGHTEQALREAYGENWRESIELGEILGSGCIGQVYRGTLVTDSAPTSSNTYDIQPKQHVAVKVLHPGVHVDIDADLDIMRVAVRAIKYLPFDMFANLKWLNMEGVVEEFAGLLKLQIDLRREAANLERFNANFKSDPAIQFPELVPGFAPSEKVLVETFCEGVPVLQFCRDNQENQLLLSKLCVQAIRAVCKMIFIDNFVHGAYRYCLI